MIMLKENMFSFMNRFSVLMLLLSGISCTHTINKGGFMGLLISATKEQVLAVLREKPHINHIDFAVSRTYSLNNYKGSYRQLIDVLLDQPGIHIETKSFPAFTMQVAFKDSFVDTVSVSDASGGKDFMINSGMDKSEVRDILLKNQRRIKSLYNISISDHSIDLENMDAHDYELIVSHDTWVFNDDKSSTVKLIFVDDLLYKIEY